MQNWIWFRYGMDMAGPQASLTSPSVKSPKSLILLFRVEVSISCIVLTGLRKSQQDFLKQTQIRVAAILEREWFLVTFFPKALTA